MLEDSLAATDPDGSGGGFSPTSGPDAVRRALAGIQRHPAWAVLRLRDEQTLHFVGGPLSHVDRLGEVPLEQGVPAAVGSSVPVWDRLLAVPFRQVAERGFEAHDDGTPLAVVEIEDRYEVDLDTAIEVLPQVELEFKDRGGFETDDEAYEQTVASIIRDEIGKGEGANLVVGRHFRAAVADWDAARALGVLRRLLESERGAYWTFCFFTGDRYLIGASPERHVSVVPAGPGEPRGLSDVPG